MLIAFDDGSAVHELEVVVHDPDATVADLVRALDPTQRAPLARGRRRRPARPTAGSIGPPSRPAPRSPSPMTRGTLSDEPSGDRPTDRRAPLATLRVAGGLEAGEQAELRIGRVTVGRGAPLAGLRSTTVSAHHAELTLDGDGRVTVADRGLAQRHVARRPPGRGADARRPGIGPAPRRGPPRRGGAAWTTARSALAVARTTGPATVPFNRPPRPATPTASDPVEPPTPPATRAPPHPVGVVSVVAPIAMGLLMVVVFDSLLFGLFALLSPVVLLGHRAREPAARPPRWAPRPAAVRPGAGRLPHDPRGASRSGTRAARRGAARPGRGGAPCHHPEHPSVGAAPRPPRRVAASGSGSDRCRGTRRWRASPRRLPAEVAAAIDDAGVLLDAPVALDLSEGTVVGVVGHRAAALAVARSLVLQAATHHGPADLGLAVVVSPDHATELGLGEVASAHARARAARPRAGSPADRDERRPALPGDARRGRRRRRRLVVLDDEA